MGEPRVLEVVSGTTTHLKRTKTIQHSFQALDSQQIKGKREERTLIILRAGVRGIAGAKNVGVLAENRLMERLPLDEGDLTSSNSVPWFALCHLEERSVEFLPFVNKVLARGIVTCVFPSADPKERLDSIPEPSGIASLD
jgi:hypothetical protein